MRYVLKPTAIMFERCMPMRLRTIALISTLALGLVAGPMSADAQQAGKTPGSDS